MSYPNSIKQFTFKIDKNASGYYVGPEYFNVPAASPYTMYLDHVPKSSVTTVVGASGGAAWTEVLVTPTATHQYLIDYDTGKVTFYSANANEAVQATYYNLGDDIMAEHVNSLQDEVELIEETVGDKPQGSYNNIRERLSGIDVAITASGISGTRIVDNTIRAGALRDDIKGASWDLTHDVLTDISTHKNKIIAAHAASAISAIGPGTTAITDVQGHISQLGSTTGSPKNPHGLTMGDVGAGIVNNDFFANNIYAKLVGISGVMLAINTLGPDADQYIYFYNNSSNTNRFLRWNNGSDIFEINDDLTILGGITASGNIIPEASGARLVGTQVTAFSEGNFGTVRADSGIFSTITGGGSGIKHSSLGSLAWSLAGHTIDANIVPTASGTQSVGTIALSLGSGNFDAVQAVSYKTGASTGATGQFTTNDGKTVRVKNGLIVSIA